MKTNNRITYRFNESGQPVNQPLVDSTSKERGAMNEAELSKQQQTKVVPIHKDNYDSYGIAEFSPWNTAFQEDISALEKLIRETDEPSEKKRPKAMEPAVETAEPSPVPSHYEEFEGVSSPRNDIRVVPDSDHRELEIDFIDGSGGRQWPVRHYSTPPSWMKVFASVAAALATGALFGYLLLSLFTGGSLWPGGDNSAIKPAGGTIAEPNGKTAASGAGSQSDSNGVDAGTAGKGVPAGSVSGEASKIANLSLPTQSYFLLQYGVFSNAEGLQAAITELEGKGRAAAGIQTATDYRAYTAISDDRSQAIALSKGIEGMEVYVKQIDLEVPQRFPFAGEPTAAETFFGRTSDVVAILGKLSTAQLEQPQLSPLGTASVEAWQEAHRRWTESVKAMETGVKDKEGQEFLIKLIQSVNSAAKAMEEYDKKPSQSHLHALQSSLMNAVLTQKQWFESISAL
ncbi:hypothetical protein [Paenibacillus sp. NEAU-GSW1]|uniref:hypothetical protein n=1 Tax=Paenibacillus sp. NEAU-GSW1 TaxID=2682486 RepID=UPI0012E304A6|nr:hypothetical protein [Paenibacillus sp. NEAU-GSW1]MUT64521.1 hypothetical protein [Paenibacillus sp. NEAU-GSW1]